MVDAQLLTLMHDACHGAHYSAPRQRGYRSAAPPYEDPFAALRVASPSRTGSCFRATARFVPSEAYDTEGDTSDEDDDDFVDDDFDDDDEDEDDAGAASPGNPSQLLAFAGAVTADIRTLFARNKEADDYCDVYEERFQSTLSGRELYYADLLALASNGDAAPRRRRQRAAALAGSRSSSSASSPTVAAPAEHTVLFSATGEAAQCTLPHEGRCVAAYGLGPLEELFRDAAWRDHAAGAGFKGLSCAYQGGGGGATPMTLRKLPDSFWEEPGHGAKVALPAIGTAPDFHDLFAHWTA